MKDSTNVPSRPTDIMIAVIFIGLQGSGKTEFYHRYFADAYTHIELDSLATRKNEKNLINECIKHGESYVIDNENAKAEDRARYFERARAAGYHVVGYYFESDVHTALERKGLAHDRRAQRQFRRVFTRLTPPSFGEGFDEIYTVSMQKDGEFIVVQST